MHQAHDVLTELQSDGPRLTKLISRNDAGEIAISGYDNGLYFGVHEHAVGSIRDVASKVEQIALSPRSALIRGRLLDPTQRLRTRRLKSNFADEPRRYSFHDLDGIDEPPGLDWRMNPEAAVSHAVTLLPTEFHDVTCWWAFTSGQGFKPKLRLRLAFWHDRAVSGEDLTVWLAERIPDPSSPARSWRKVCPVDEAVYRPVQPIYVAKPIFDGVADPVPQRSGLLMGARETVATPYPIRRRFAAVATGRQPARLPSARQIKDLGSPATTPATTLGTLDAVLGDGPGRAGFYEPLMAAAAGWVRANGPDAASEALIPTLTGAALAAPRAGGAERLAEVQARIANLPALVAWLQDKERETREREQAIGLPCAPPCDLPSMTLAEAEAAVEQAASIAFREFMQAIDARREYLAECGRRRARLPANTAQEVVEHLAFADLEKPDMPQIGIGAAVGIGKTEAALHQLVRFVDEDGFGRVAYAVPTHKTGDEIASRLNKLAGREIAAAWRGTTQADPRIVQPMCPMHLVVDAMRKTGGGVRDICGGSERGWCAHNPARPGARPETSCGYRQQFAEHIRVWIVPHAMLTHAAPPDFGAGRLFSDVFDMLVVDEAPWLSFLGGMGPRPTKIRLQELRSISPGRHMPSQSTAFTEACRALADALESQAGLVKREAVVAAGISASSARGAAGLARMLIAKPAIRRHLEANAQALDLYEEGDTNGALVLIGRLWSLVAEFLRSGADLAPWTLSVEADESGQQAVHLRWKEAIHADWISGPVLHLDATSIPEVARCWLPDLRMGATVRAVEPNVTRVQLIDRAVGKSSLIVARSQEERERQQREIHALRQFIELAAFAFRGTGRAPGPDVSIATYLDAEHRLSKGFGRSVETGHFNALRGFDGWRGVAVQIIIGRPEASPAEVEKMAVVATGRIGQSIGAQWYPRTDAALLMADGTGRRVKAYAHPDPNAEAFRQQVQATELEQVEGRGRGVRRGPASRLLSIIITSAPTRLPIHAAITKADLFEHATTIALLAARGIVPSTSGDAAMVLSQITGKAETAGGVRKRLEREGEPNILAALTGEDVCAGESESVTGPYKIPGRDLSHFQNRMPIARMLAVSAEAWSKFRAFRYRRTQSRRSGMVLLDPSRHAAPAAAFAAAVGAMDYCVPAPLPAWLARLVEIFDPAERDPAPTAFFVPIAVPSAPSAHAEILGINHRTPTNRPRLQPLAGEIYRVGRGGMLVSVYSTDFSLRQSDGMQWPPAPWSAPAPVQTPEIAPSPAAVSSIDIARAAGITLGKLRSWMLSPTAKRRAREVGQERAEVEVMMHRLGRARVLDASAKLFSR